MMKMNKKNLLTVVLLALGIISGNTATNYAIARKNGYRYNKETKQLEKKCIFGIDLSTEDEIAKSNLAWSLIGTVAGLVLHYTVIDR